MCTCILHKQTENIYNIDSNDVLRGVLFNILIIIGMYTFSVIHYIITSLYFDILVRFIFKS